MAKLTRACGVVIVLLAFSFSFARTTLAATSSNCGGWSIVSSPNDGKKANDFSSVAAISADDIWAVGNAGNKTLTEHWNGTQWNVVTSPNLHTSKRFSNLLRGVAAVATNDVWAVGYIQYDNGYSLKYQPLAQHWDGTQWSIVPTPTPTPAEDGVFNAVAAIAANNVWAVGSGLIEHWDGTQWSVVSFPNTAIGLFAITALSANDMWVSGIDASAQTVTEHWDGTQWRIVPTPGINASSNSLSALAAVSSNDVWAVGYSFNHGQTSTLLEHWDGTQWSIVPGAQLDPGDNMLLGVVAISSNDVWAVGFYGTGLDQTLIEQWNGTQWNTISSPNPGTFSELQAVALIPTTTQLWTVGTYDITGGNGRTLTAYYC